MFAPRLRSTARPLVRAARGIADRIDAVAIGRRAARMPAGKGGWKAVAVRRARNGTRIVTLRTTAGRTLVMKLSDRSDGMRRLSRERDVLTELHRQIPDASLRDLVPEPVAGGMHGGWAYLVQTALPGVGATPFIADEGSRSAILDDASRVARRFHEATARRYGVSDDELVAWIDRPLDAVADLARVPRTRFELLRDELRSALGKRDQVRGIVHGDLWPENLLVDPNDHRVLGVVDWDSAEFQGLALHDQIHLLLYTRKLVRRTAIGTEICRALSEAAATVERPLVPAVEAGDVGSRVALLLYWLRLVSYNLARQPAETRRLRWVRANVSAVLACL